jgi:hypothetical protein
MGKFIKIVLTISVAVVIAYAQTSDTSSKPDSTLQGLNQQSSSAIPVVSPSVGKKGITKIIPKAPTNWSKVKDLFL